MAINWDEMAKKAKSYDQRNNAKQGTQPSAAQKQTAAAQPYKVETSVNAHKMPTLGEKLNVQSRMPQPITPLMAQLGGTSAKKAVPMTPLMQKISAQVPAPQKKIALEDNPNILERFGKTLAGTAKTGTGGWLNTFGYTRRVLDSGIKGDTRDNLMDFNRKEKERLEKELADPKTNALKRWALEREIRDLDDALTGRDRVHEKKNELMQGGAEDFARAQQGASWLGKLGLDALSAGSQLGADVLIGKALGTNATIPMAIRSFGSGAHTAEQEGAGLLGQGAYGAASAAVEVLTEKMFDGLAGAFGKGAADDIIENLIGKLAKTDNGRTALRIASSAGGEGIEEIISGAVDPVLRSIYNGQTPLENYKSENIVDWLYDGLVGAILGGVGGGVNVATGRNAQQNAELAAKTQDVAQKPSAIAPALLDIAPQPAQASTRAQNSLEVKLPAESQNATQGAVEPVVDNKPALKVKPVPVEQHAIFPENSIGAKIAQQLPQGMGAASNSFVPEQKVSKVFTNTYQKTDSLTDEQRAQMNPENYQYDVRGHAQNETAAQQRVDVDYDGEILDLYEKENWSAEDVFTAKKIMDKLSAENDYEKLSLWSKKVQIQGTKPGQTVEAFKAFQKTPEGAVIKAQQVVAAAEAKLTTKKEVGKKVQTSTGRKITDDIDNVTKIVDALTSGKETTGMAKTLNKVTLKEIKQLVASGKYDAEAINNLVKEKYGIPTLTATDVQKIYELNKLAQETSNDYQKRVYLNRSAKIIADKLPVTGKQKVLAVRRIAMLLNPKTLISRNAGGNVVFGILDDIKDAPGTLIDLGVSKITGNRTTSYNPFATSKAEFLGMKKGLSEWGKDIKNKVDTSPTEHEMPRTPSFKGAVGRGFEEALNKLLQLGDRPFYEAAKAKRLDELKRLGLDYTSEDAVAEANVYALDRVFQNNSTLAKKAVQLRDSLGVLGDIAIPFAQTPANIFDKLADYSPYGFVRAIKKAGTIKDSAWSQKQFVDTLSRSLTGTGILTLAYFAAQAGLISGGEDREEDEGLSYQKKISGWQPYSVVVGDKTYTYDWMTVGGALLSLGADIAQSENAGDTMLAILSAGAKAGINTMFNQSYLEGISELFGGEDIASGLESVLLGLPASFTPTAFQQIAKIIDPIARDTYDTDPFKRAWNKVKAKLPYASKTLPAKIGASGEELTNFQGSKATNIFESVLSPGYIGENQKTAIDTEAHRLYRATGDSGVLPKWSKYTSKGDMSITVDGEKLAMSTSEWGQYQKTRGKQTYKMLDELIKSPDYKSMTDAQKADAMQGIIGYASDIAKGEYAKTKGKEYESSTYAKVREVEAAGISPVKYFEYQNALKKERPEGGTPSQLQFSKAINTLNISDKQKGKLWEIQNGESSDKNPFTGELAAMGMQSRDIIGTTERYDALLEDVTDETAEAAGANKSEIRSSYIRQWLRGQGYTAEEIDIVITSLGFAKKTSSESEAYAAANPR